MISGFGDFVGDEVFLALDLLVARVLEDLVLAVAHFREHQGDELVLEEKENAEVDEGRDAEEDDALLERHVVLEVLEVGQALLALAVEAVQSWNFRDSIKLEFVKNAFHRNILTRKRRGFFCCCHSYRSTRLS